MKTPMSKELRAHRYLQASQSAGLTGLPEEAREAYEQQMSAHERAYPDVRTHAIVGTNSDFDTNLSAGEREHQGHLREEEGHTNASLLEARKQLRQGAKPKTTRTTAKAVGAGGRAGKSYFSSRRAARSLGYPANLGSTLLESAGLAIGVILLYLVLSPNGSKAFATLLNGVSSGLRLFVGPGDPLNPTVKTATSTSTSTAAPPGEGPDVFSPSGIAKIKAKNPAFGPSPSSGNVLQPVGGIK
jgi:hypothetical protein